jgi:hypothetical protein
MYGILNERLDTAKRRGLILMMVLLLIPAYAFSTGSVSGKVTITFKGTALEAAYFDVEFLDAKNAVLLDVTKTDGEGNYSSLLNPGTYRIRASGRLVISKDGTTICAEEYHSTFQPGADIFEGGTDVMVSEGSTTTVDFALTGSDVCAFPCTEGIAYLTFSIQEINTTNGIPGIVFEFRDAYNALIRDFKRAVSYTEPGMYALSVEWGCYWFLKVRLVDSTGNYMPQYVGANQSDDFYMGSSVDLASCGNKDDPCFFEVAMVRITPAQQISQLQSEIANAGLPAKVQGSLSAPLDQAYKLLTDNNPHNDIAACGHLRGFTAQLNGKVASGEISQSTADQMQALAAAVASGLGCR